MMHLPVLRAFFRNRTFTSVVIVNLTFHATQFLDVLAKIANDKFYNCVYGKPHELPCATSLIFDEAQGTCVRPEQASAYAKKCEIKKEPGKK